MMPGELSQLPTGLSSESEEKKRHSTSSHQDHITQNLAQTLQKQLSLQLSLHNSNSTSNGGAPVIVEIGRSFQSSNGNIKKDIVGSKGQHDGTWITPQHRKAKAEQADNEQNIEQLSTQAMRQKASDVPKYSLLRPRPASRLTSKKDTATAESPLTQESIKDESLLVRPVQNSKASDLVIPMPSSALNKAATKGAKTSSSIHRPRPSELPRQTPTTSRSDADAVQSGQAQEIERPEIGTMANSARGKFSGAGPVTPRWVLYFTLASRNSTLSCTSFCNPKLAVPRTLSLRA